MKKPRLTDTSLVSFRGIGKQSMPNLSRLWLAKRTTWCRLVSGWSVAWLIRLLLLTGRLSAHRNILSPACVRVLLKFPDTTKFVNGCCVRVKVFDECTWEQLAHHLPVPYCDELSLPGHSSAMDPHPHSQRWRSTKQVLDGTLEMRVRGREYGKSVFSHSLKFPQIRSALVKPYWTANGGLRTR